MIHIGRLGSYFCALIILKTHPGISSTYVTTEIYIQGCTIVCVDTIKICGLFSGYQYKLVLDFILMIYVALVASSPALNT